MMYTEEAMDVEAQREYFARVLPAATPSDAHAQWHAVNGRYAVCPMDCGIGEGLADEYEEGGISCGHCKGRHGSVAGVRECATFHLAEKDRRHLQVR